MLTAPAPVMGISTQRPVPLVRRADLVIQSMEFRGVRHYAVKDPIGLKYHLLTAGQFVLLEALDGKRSLEELREQVVRALPTDRPTLMQLQQLIADLHTKGLVYSQRPGQGESKLQTHRETRARQIRQALLNVLAIRLPGWDPDRALCWLLPWTRWLFHPVTVVLVLTALVASWVVLAIEFVAFRADMPTFQQFFGWPNLLWLWLTLGVAKVLHEFGHGLACRHFGAECHEMGVMLLVLSPCLYCDASDSWMLRSKWQRMAIGAAGMYVESILSSLAVFVWASTQPGIWHYLALNVFFVTAATTIVFNANPLLRLDGYYILSDWLEIPNLRQKADTLVRDLTSVVLLGIPLPNDPFRPNRGRAWFVAYSLASFVYGWFIFFTILWFLYTWLKPYELQSLGVSVVVASLVSLCGGFVMQAYQVLKTPRREPLKPLRLFLTATVLGAVVAAIAYIPAPWYRSAPFLIEPLHVHDVRTTAAGELLEVQVQPGNQVAAGDTLARLSDPEKTARLTELEQQLILRQAEVRLADAAEDPGERAIAIEAVRSLQQELAELREHIARLTVIAPIAGTVVAPPRVPPPTLEQSRQRLSGWHGTPLDRRNAGCFLPVQSHLLSLSPTDKVQAVIYLDQADRHDVHAWMQIRLKFDHLPQEVFVGHVREVGSAQVESAPSALSNKQGGGLATVTDREGREKLNDAAYQALVDFEQPLQLRTGLRGEARFIVANRTVGQWVWRAIRRTFDFRV